MDNHYWVISRPNYKDYALLEKVGEIDHIVALSFEPDKIKDVCKDMNAEYRIKHPEPA